MASWFYLTLWRGNPPELTDLTELEIETIERTAAGITTSSKADAAIGAADQHAADVHTTDRAAAGIERKTEVTWNVGKKH